MKTKAFYLVIAAVLLLGSVGATSVLDNALSLANVTVFPNPVVAGGTATIRFHLYNSYGSFVQTVNLQASASYPITNTSLVKTTDIAQVNPGINPGYYNYTFAIPSTTPSGTYKVYFNASYFGLGATEVVASSSMPVSFYVQNKPVIKVVLSGPSPAALYSGYNQTLKLEIENTGYGTARNVTVSLGSAQGVNLLSSVTNFYISNLTQGQTVNESILVSAQNVGSASILTSISYYSSTLSQHFSNVQSVGLSIAPAAQFTVGSGAASNAGPGATDVPVKFTITNSGTSEADQLQLSLQSSYPITPVASTAYIASLPSGASANVTFLVSVDSQGVPGNYPVTVYEQWKQPNGAINQQFSGSNNYFVSVGSQSGATTLIVAGMVVVVVVGLVAYRIRSSLSKKQQKKK